MSLQWYIPGNARHFIQAMAKVVITGVVEPDVNQRFPIITVNARHKPTVGKPERLDSLVVHSGFSNGTGF